MIRRTNSRAANPVGSPIVAIPFRPLVVKAFQPPRPGSMAHLELPSLAGGQRHYPKRPWAVGS